MTKKIFIALFLIMFAGTRPAYAIFDVLATLETALEYKQEIEHKIKEIQKFKDDNLKRLKQGFVLATSCFKHPDKCGSREMVNFLRVNGNARTYIKRLDRIATMPGSKTMAGGNLWQKPQCKMTKDVEDTYIYKRGRGDDLKETKKNRDNINGIIINDIASLFAKGATTKHSILGEEDSELYPDIGDKNDIDEVLQAESRVLLATTSRLARVLELRANMMGAESTSELTQQSTGNEEDE